MRGCFRHGRLPAKRKGGKSWRASADTTESSQVTQFADLGLAESILRALTREGYTTPTPIQAQAIPPALERKDILGIAQTGTGKTCAFARPILTRLLAKPQPLRPKYARVLV